MDNENLIKLFKLYLFKGDIMKHLHTPIILMLKKHILTFIICVFPIFILLFSQNNIVAVKSGLLLWVNNIIPSLFPFFIATELLMHTNIVNQLGIILNRLMKPLFNVRGEGAFAFVMGIISGYPVGAKIATNFRQNNVCTKEECERLLSFTNNSGPLFVIGTVGILIFKSSTIGILLFITHIISSISVGIIFRFWKKNITSNDYIKTSTFKTSNYKNVSF